MATQFLLLSGVALISTATEYTTTNGPNNELEGLCDPSLLYGLSPFEGDGSIQTIDFNIFDIYYNQSTLQGPGTENVTGWTYFGYKRLSQSTCLNNLISSLYLVPLSMQPQI